MSSWHLSTWSIHNPNQSCENHLEEQALVTIARIHRITSLLCLLTMADKQIQLKSQPSDENPLSVRNPYITILVIIQWAVLILTTIPCQCLRKFSYWIDIVKHPIRAWWRSGFCFPPARCLAHHRCQGQTPPWLGLNPLVRPTYRLPAPCLPSSWILVRICPLR